MRTYWGGELKVMVGDGWEKTKEHEALRFECFIILLR